MFIARRSGEISGAVRRGGTQLCKYQSSFIPPLRTAPVNFWVLVYKHLTPIGVKNRRDKAGAEHNTHRDSVVLRSAGVRYLGIHDTFNERSGGNSG